MKATISANKSAKGASQGQRNILKPMVHEDCFYLRITQPPTDSAPNTPPNVRWERRKKPANSPSPPRVGVTMTYHKGRGIFFGGVHDVEHSEEGIDSEFFNQLYAWNIERNRFFPLTLRKPRVQKKVPVSEQRVGRRGRAQANEEELLKQLAALQAGSSLEDADAMDIEIKAEKETEEPEKPAREMPVTMELPHPRFNAQLAVQDDVLYIYGGTYEAKDREYTFDDLYAIDLGKMDGCKQIFKREDDTWVVRPPLLSFWFTMLGEIFYKRSPNICYRAPTMKKTTKTTKMRMTRMTRKMMRVILKCPMRVKCLFLKASERRSRWMRCQYPTRRLL